MNNDSISSPYHNQTSSPESSNKSTLGKPLASQAKGSGAPSSLNNANNMINNQFNITATMMSGGFNQSSSNPKGDAKNVLTGIENYDEVRKINGQLEDVIEDLDKKLNRVLAKQEYEYLKGYNIYVKRKEKELRELIEKLNEKNSNNTLKDEKINNLERTIHILRDDQIKQEKEKDSLALEIKKWKTKALGYEQEKNFLQNQIMDAKRQNKLLKLAIGRLQNELEKYEAIPPPQQMQNMSADGANTKVFLTENYQQPADIKADKLLELLKAEYYGSEGQPGPLANMFPPPPELSQFIEGTTAQTSQIDAIAGGLSKLSADQKKRIQQNLTGGNTIRRVMTRSPMSRYHHIPTENLKFTKFLDLLFNSKMQRDGIKQELLNYVKALETNYTDHITDLKVSLDREKGRIRKVQSDKVNTTTEKNELESLFVDCIEEVRKDIMKRRLKNEIYNKKKFQQIEKSSEEAREFEESLLRLAQLAKNRIKISDFTTKDKCNLLDLFVNNEKTLLKIYEALFPHRAAAAQQQTTSAVGQMIHNNIMTAKEQVREKLITSKNNQLQQQLVGASYFDNETAADTRHGQNFPKILPSIKNGVAKSGIDKIDNNSSSLGDNMVRVGTVGDAGRGGDPYNNTMVEFGSIRQSHTNEINKTLKQSFN